MAVKHVNKVILIGEITSDPRKRETSSGSLVVNAKLETVEDWIENKSNQMQSRATIHDLVFFSQVAESAINLKRGENIYVEGSIRENKWHDKGKGLDREKSEVVVSVLSVFNQQPGSRL